MRWRKRPETERKGVAVMATFSGNVPSADRILTLLASLYADQCGVTATVSVVDKIKERKDGNDRNQTDVRGV